MQGLEIWKSTVIFSFLYLVICFFTEKCQVSASGITTTSCKACYRLSESPLCCCHQPKHPACCMELILFLQFSIFFLILITKLCPKYKGGLKIIAIFHFIERNFKWFYFQIFLSELFYLSKSVNEYLNCRFIGIIFSLFFIFSMNCTYELFTNCLPFRR